MNHGVKLATNLGWVMNSTHSKRHFEKEFVTQNKGDFY
jgi:hypothetical protein